MSRVQVSIVIPCLNEAETIGTVINKVLESDSFSKYTTEIIVADNGSTDGTLAILKDLPVKIVSVQERGYGSAIRGGLASCKGKYIVMADADDSYELENFSKFVVPLESGFDVVIGDRFEGGIQKSAMPLLHRYLGNPVLSLIARILFKSEIKDFNCGIRAARRDKLESLHLLSKGMEFAFEMLIKSERHLLRIHEIPTILRPDGRSKRPHLNTWRDGWRDLKFLLAYAPNWVTLYPGILLSLMGAISLFLDYWFELVFFSKQVDGMGAIFSSVVMCLGFNFIFFSLMVSRLWDTLIPNSNSDVLYKIQSFLDKKPTKYLALSIQFLIFLWFIFLVVNWLSGNLELENQITRIKFGTALVSVSIGNLYYLTYTILSHFIDSELNPSRLR